jgi:hypothetical protein
MAIGIGSVSLEEQLRMAESARDYASQQQEAYKETVSLMANMSERAKEYVDHGKDSLVNYSRIADYECAIHGSQNKYRIAK